MINTSEGQRDPLTDSDLHSAVWYAAKNIADSGQFGNATAADVLREYFDMIEVDGALYSIADCEPCDVCGSYINVRFNEEFNAHWCEDHYDDALLDAQEERATEAAYYAEERATYYQVQGA